MVHASSVASTCLVYDDVSCLPSEQVVHISDIVTLRLVMLAGNIIETTAKTRDGTRER